MQLAFPLDALQFLLSELYPEAVPAVKQTVVNGSYWHMPLNTLLLLAPTDYIPRAAVDIASSEHFDRLCFEIANFEVSKINELERTLRQTLFLAISDPSASLKVVLEEP